MTGEQAAPNLLENLRRSLAQPPTCFFCGKNLHRSRGYYELTRQPGDELRSFCSVECLHWQVHKDMEL